MNECYEAASCAQMIKPWLQLWIALWYTGFIAYYLYQAAREKKLIVEGQLVLSELLWALVNGLFIPVSVTVAGVVVSLLHLTAGSCPDQSLIRCGSSLSFSELFYGLTLLFVLLLIALVIIALLLWLAAILIRAIRSFLCAAVTHGASTWKAVRPHIPIRW